MEQKKPFLVRKPARIPGYDYSKENYYFITICTHEKKCIFGNADDLNSFGKIAMKDLQELASRYTGISIDICVVMPNHIHAILVINGQPEKKVSLHQIIGLYKSGVSRKIRKLAPDTLVWQRSFHDHIIRTQSSYEKIYRYIQFNSQKWEEDRFYPNKKKP